jgi:hypothetical protein
MKHPLAGRLQFFWNWDPRSWRLGWSGPVPALPFSWRLALGPLGLARVTTRHAERMTRQRRRHLQRQIRKAVKRA